MSVKSPQISVVMAVYDGLPNVGKAIRSVLDQTFKDFEFIIINDGSKDGSKKVLEDFKKKDSRIRTIHQKNKGLAAALNNGICHARGDYIARMDDDDICLAQRFERQVNYLEGHPKIDLLSTPIKFIDENGNKTGDSWQLPTSPSLVKWSLFFGSCISHPSVMMRRTPVLEVGGYDEKMRVGQDYNLWARMVTNGYELDNLSEPLLLARRWTGSTTVRSHEQQRDNGKKTAYPLHENYIGQNASRELISWLFDLRHGGVSYLTEEHDLEKQGYYRLREYIRTLRTSFLAHENLSPEEEQRINQDAIVRQQKVAAGIRKVSPLEGEFLRVKDHATLRPLRMLRRALEKMKNLLRGLFGLGAGLPLA
ncbi:glycosyltransferase [Salinibacter ruber]|uniref:glycosyltransferase n=1 Tax=Salinibacter ruber TaxID=146919 RepID=UPI002342F6DC|nr:glycosyltransferase [Salinibacter ruber]